jgi:hypothetical protein
MANGSEEPGSPTIPVVTDPAGSDETRPLGIPVVTRPAPSAPPPGWYPDPWLASQQRYWTGDRWTLDTLPDGPGSGPPPPPPGRVGPVPMPDPLVPPDDRRRGRALVAVAAVIGLLIGLGAAYAFSRGSHDTNNSATPALTLPTTPSTTVPAVQPAQSSDPGASALNRLVVTQNDVGSPLVVGELSGGNQVTGETTLDLCNGTYPSESLRTARVQVAAADPQASAVALSTEAVLYKNAGSTAQAFTELQSVAAHCPSTPVVSPVGEATVTTHFNHAPDSSWPQVPKVDRLAYDFVSTDDQGNSVHSVAVYLRRGRALLGVYFGQPDGAQAAVGGQTNLAGIVNVFANRLANLPTSVVNGGVS